MSHLLFVWNLCGIILRQIHELIILCDVESVTVEPDTLVNCPRSNTKLEFETSYPKSTNN